MQPPESPDNKDFIREFSGHVSVLLVALFTVSTTAQIYSRPPGVTGPRFFGLYFIAGLFVFCLYSQIKLTVTGQVDAIGMETTLGISLMWFAVHGICRALHQARGVQVHSHEPGYGLFTPLYRGLPVWLSTLISDVTVTIGIGLYCHINASPIHRDWFAWMVLPSVVISQAWVQSRQAFLRQRFVDASAEASHYADAIGRR